MVRGVVVVVASFVVVVVAWVFLASGVSVPDEVTRFVSLSKSGKIADQAAALKPPPAPEELLSQMAEAEKTLADTYDHASDLTPDAIVKLATDNIGVVAESYEQLGCCAEVPLPMEQEAQVISMRCQYLASKLIPQYASNLNDQAEQIVAIRPGTDHAAMATMLMYCGKYEMDGPLPYEARVEFDEQVQQFSDSRHGVWMASFVAQELWNHGQTNSAKQVLEHSIELFKNDRNRIRLVNQLIDQGHRPPPKPKVSAEMYARMLKACEAVQNSKKTQFR